MPKLAVLYDAGQAVLSTFDLDEVLQRILAIARDYFRLPNVAILLIDARNGVRTQSKRHAKIARLLGITDFVLAINKMDLVGFDREVYEKILDDFSEFLTGASVHAIPMSALEGDNVITLSERTPYFDGPPLLEYLETVQVHRNLPRIDDVLRAAVAGQLGVKRGGHDVALTDQDGLPAVRGQNTRVAHG